MNAKHVTIGQVAEIAGVSIQTVSRVLNNRPDVAPETRQRVQLIIANLGYQPYALARGLASRRTRTLGLITFDFNDYSFTQIVTGAENEIRKYGYFFMLGSTNCNPNDEPKYLRLLSERHVEGILFARAGSEYDKEHLLNLQKSGVPIVTTGFYQPGAEFTVVDINNVHGGTKATQCLIDHGHLQIAMITGPQFAKSTHDRALGYHEALQSAGVTSNPQLVAIGDWSYRSGYQTMRTILDSHLPFSAVFAHNDRMAIGAILALRQAGKRVPQDISITGYDDMPEAEFADPPLTTIRQRMYEVGELAARLLIQLIEDPTAIPTQHLLETELIMRSSCFRREGNF